MYNNIGDKIKLIAKVVAWIGIILSVALGIFTLVASANVPDADTRLSMIFSGVIYLIVGPLAAWAGSCITYGFGYLINETNSIRKHVTNLEQQLNQMQVKKDPGKDSSAMWAPANQDSADE